MPFNQPNWYISLLGLAEHFRTLTPPDIPKCLKCLTAIFNFQPDAEIRVRTHLQIANVLTEYTKNTDLAKQNLDTAWKISRDKYDLTGLRLEVGSELAKLHVNDNNSLLAKSVLKKAISFSSGNRFWHCRLLFQLANIYLSEKSIDAASGLLRVGHQYANRNCSNYHRALFLFSRCILLLTDKKLLEFEQLSNSFTEIVDTWQGEDYKKEYAQVCLQVLRSLCLLMTERSETAESTLKDLMKRYLHLRSLPECANMKDELVWLSDDVLNVLIRSLGVLYNSLVGNGGQVLKHSEKILTSLDKLKSSSGDKLLTPLEQLVLAQVASWNSMAQEGVPGTSQ